MYVDQTQSVQHQDKSSPLLRPQTLAERETPDERKNDLKAKKKISKRVSTVDACETRNEKLADKSDI